MKVLFLDFDGVLNSVQSAIFWHNRRDQAKWENEMYRDWTGTLKEYIAMEFCPIAMSNVEELLRNVDDLRVVVSSTWRMGETVESLKKILAPSKIICERLLDTTPVIYKEGVEVARGIEIQHWLNNTDQEVDAFVIVDDDNDMEHLGDKLVCTSPLHGFQYGDIDWAMRILGLRGVPLGTHFI